MPALTPDPNPWLQTLPRHVLGEKLDLVHPHPSQINWRTVAAVSARVGRFANHTGEHYSVAQHEVEGARAIIRETRRRDHAAAFLIHDAHEYAIGDTTTPVTDALCAHAVLHAGDIHAGDVVRGAYHSLKAALDAAIYPAAGLPWPLDAETQAAVKLMDLRMCRTERDVRMAPAPFAWAEAVETAVPVEGCDLSVWTEYEARHRYWDACCELLSALREPVEHRAPQLTPDTEQRVRALFDAERLHIVAEAVRAVRRSNDPSSRR